MKFLFALFATCVSLANAVTPPAAPTGFSLVGEGSCKNDNGRSYDYCYQYNVRTVADCAALCLTNTNGLQGFDVDLNVTSTGRCNCLYDDGKLDALIENEEFPPGFLDCFAGKSAVGDVDAVEKNAEVFCYSDDRDKTPPVTEVTGDPHFRTWKNEHFEFHGQCDLVMTKIENFANKAIDLDIHIRTSMVRYWSYVKTAAVRIGNDILEVEGSVAKEDGVVKGHYHINYEHLGPLTDLGGYPVTISPRNNKYTIDLDKDYPGQKIEIKTFKEFVGVKIIGATAESFGNAIGIMGDFRTGNTYARDGSTVLNDFTELGLEWQVLPSDGKLFHEIASPQFPELCYLPEDPRGDRARRLGESDVTEEAAEAACANLKDEFDRKGCIYDILATQDMDMVGAY